MTLGARSKGLGARARVSFSAAFDIPLTGVFKGIFSARF